MVQLLGISGILDWLDITSGYLCYDLAKWLGHYLYFFSFSFHLIRKSMDVQEGMTKRRYMGLYK